METLSTEEFEAVRNRIIDYVITNHPSDHTAETLPLDESLVELEILDSFGVVELVLFLETTWSITIPDSDITREKMGSVNKMTTLVLEKTEKRPRLHEHRATPI